MPLLAILCRFKKLSTLNEAILFTLIHLELINETHRQTGRPGQNRRAGLTFCVAAAMREYLKEDIYDPVSGKKQLLRKDIGIHV